MSTHGLRRIGDPLDALQLLDGMFANTNPRLVVLLRDLQLHMEQMAADWVVYEVKVKRSGK